MEVIQTNMIFHNKFKNEKQILYSCLYLLVEGWRLKAYGNKVYY